MATHSSWNPIPCLAEMTPTADVIVDAALASKPKENPFLNALWIADAIATAAKKLKGRQLNTGLIKTHALKSAKNLWLSTRNWLEKNWMSI